MTDQIETDDLNEKAAPVSFSIRLTEKQRDLLKRAASQKGWSVTGLLKTAALEKAAHIVNTGRPKQSLDFEGVAKVVAEQVFEPRSAHLAEVDPEEGLHTREASVTDSLFDLHDSFGDDVDLENTVEVTHLQKDAAFLEDFQQAARYGGTEFLEKILQASERILGRVSSSPENLVDPSTGE